MFRKFLIEKGIIATAISYVIGNQINYLIKSILECIIQPIMEADYNNDNKNDFQSMKKLTLKAGPYNFKLGRLFHDTLRFVLVIYFVFVISRLFINTIN